ncbi:MAG: YicC family protein [Kordiimonadaceae bacterium]|jgi:uncharacterized protein (TIGR00255 family)|nr:YicC family protein [Kordiimonadaceae bacterium]MBT6032083.1 YicC family protein [Kordiimonadaceae bacterium]
MTLSSMTGFGRTQGQFENYSWVWEIRSVNGKNLDVRMRIPPGLDAFDQYIKTNLKKLISRGSLNVSLQLQKDSDEIDVKVNEAALDKLISVAKQAAQKHDMPMPSIDNLLSIRDVVEITNKEDDEEILKKRDAKLKSSFLDAISEVKQSRDNEGAATYQMLTDVLNEIERLLVEGEDIAAQQPQALKNKFLDKVNALLEKSNFDAERITQEVVILATKADVKEETDRLHAHISSARSLLKEKGAVGRKLDFLCQEFNREANTLCSKSTDIALTNIGLSLKTAIDQFREQVQNVE